MKISEAEQTRLGSLVDQLRRELEELATDEQDRLEWYIEQMEERVATLPTQPLSFFYGRVVGCILNGRTAVRTVDAYWRALEKVFLILDPVVVSTWTVQELSRVPGIIKHKGKLRGCILAAKFFLQLEQDFGSFYSFLKPFATSSTPVAERWSVVSLLSDSIPWMGNAIACDFLKEVGLTTYSKPNVHAKRALFRHGLTPAEEIDDFTCFAEVDKLAQASGLEAAYVDRMLWVRGQKFGRW